MTTEDKLPSTKAESERSILMNEYLEKIAPTDRLPSDTLRPVLMGLFGEVGSILAIAKKPFREKESYVGFQHAIEEELGDVMWYFSTLCRRLGYETSEILSDAASGTEHEKLLAASDIVPGPISRVSKYSLLVSDDVFPNLASAVTPLLQLVSPSDDARRLLCEFANCYLQTLQISGLPFARILRSNIKKACGRFVQPDPMSLPIFDKGFPKDEQLPWDFEIKITQRKSGKSYLQWNGVFIGPP